MNEFTVEQMREWDMQQKQSQKNDCNFCKHISITEREQSNGRGREDHICNLSGKRLYHRGEHPRLPKPDDCPKPVTAEDIAEVYINKLNRRIK